WSRLSPAARGDILMRARRLIAERAARFAVVETLDSGKRLAEAEGDVGGVVKAFAYYAGAADKLQGDSMPVGPDHIGLTIEEPVGVAAQIVPWNYPLSTAARGIAPALAAGCTLVVKPAEQTPFTTLMLAELLHEAGLPAGVLNVVAGTGAEAGAALVAHPGIDHITFTGSVATGQRVMRAAAEHVTRLVLELGGKSPLVALRGGDCRTLARTSCRQRESLAAGPWPERCGYRADQFGGTARSRRRPCRSRPRRRQSHPRGWCRRAA
ncbi:MAG: aldehyde dehydrogenase family protein, partial [Rhizobium pusense]|nr:aldehyde dehydrogenase family protein [Agrobacterium pusense]